jgi:uncharacterized protein YaiI (UPF0178 family)
MLHIYIDADACPVKPEVFRVADRYGLSVTLVAARWMRVPTSENIDLQIAGNDLDAADDWIAEHVVRDDVVVTADIPLAARCLKKEAFVLGSTGKPFTEANIGSALAARELLADLRETGEVTGGPPPFSKADRSRFLQQFDQGIQAVRRKHGLDR